MKNIKFILLLLFALFIISCNDSSNPSGPGYGGISGVDPTIYNTDSTGQFIGGDTTDWCLHGNMCFSLYPAWPNPTTDTVNIRFDCWKDTVSLYTLRSYNDTVFIFKNKKLSAGAYWYRFSGDSLGFHNVVKRFYLKSKSPCNNNSECKNYGDIQFY